ncbi:reverse transcriptase domain-containing protein [Acinetobacter baumannii]|uniref:reverse transcriptase domain-containing protein n=1 Tax=Acinetobacter baumannii TaxID=470 RepID=UPI0037BE518E
MNFETYVKENFIATFNKLFRKQSSNLLTIKYYPEDLSFNEFNLKKEKILAEVLNDLATKTYSPTSLHPSFLEKSDGSLRLICIPSIKDRVIQKLILKYIKEHHESKYILATNHDFSAKISEAGAIKARTKALILRNQNPYVLKTDISSFFDNLDRRLAIKTVKEKLDIPEINYLLERIIKVETRFQKDNLNNEKENALLKSKKGKGIRQGMPMSSFLASLYLHDFDNFIEKENIKCVRYADDLIIFCSSRKQALNYLEKVTIELEKIKLNIPPLEDKSKTQIVKNKPIDFLGLEFRFGGTKFKAYVPDVVFKTIHRKLEVYDSLNKNLKNKKDFSDVIQDMKYISNGYSAAFPDACNISELEYEINTKKIIIFSKLLTSLGLDIERLSARQKKFFFSI